ncbi:hypothetical protein SBADM41S_07646 [Streptomyces badius]
MALNGQTTAGTTADGGYEVAVFLPYPLSEQPERPERPEVRDTAEGDGETVVIERDMPGMNGTDIRVLIVDDQMMVREGFSVLLNAMPGITVVGEALDMAGRCSTRSPPCARTSS